MIRKNFSETRRMKQKYCKVCGKIVSKFYSNGLVYPPITYKKMKYCSVSCSRKDNYIKPKSRFCKECGKEITVEYNYSNGKVLPRSMYEKRIFCNTECHKKARQHNRATKKDYPEGWWSKRLRDRIKKIFDYKCLLCGKNERELMQKLSIHHIDYNKKNIFENNLIPLCRPCHSKTNVNRDYWWNFFFGFMMCSDLIGNYKRVAETTTPRMN